MRHAMSLLMCFILCSSVFTSIPNNEQLSTDGTGSKSIVHDGWNHGSQEGSILSNSTATVGGGDGTTNEEFVCIIQEGSLDVYCWGKNDQGQLALGDTIDRSSPSTVGLHQNSQVPMRATTIDAGGSHTCAISTSKDIFCWGANDFGQLGAASGTAQPQLNYAIVDIDWNVHSPLAISSGGTSSCAILADNQLSKSLWCWGSILSSGNTIQPPDYQGSCPYLQIRDISSLPGSCVAPNPWDADGDGWAIHSGAYGYLQAYGQGDCNDNNPNTNPGQNEVPGDGQDNDCDGSIDETVQQIPLANQPMQVSVGKEHVCVMTDMQELYCWGDNTYHQSDALTQGTAVIEQPQLLDFSPLVTNAQTLTPLRVAAGSSHTCVILSDQSVACWGEWMGMALSQGLIPPNQMTRVSTTNPNWTPTGSSPTSWMEASSQTHALVPISISAGAEHTCITAQNIVLEPFVTPQAPAPSLRPYALCWGDGEQGQLGQGGDFNDYSEYKYVETRSLQQEGTGMADFSTIVVAGGDTTCTVKTAFDPTIRCFGSNDAGTYGHDRVWPDSYYTTDISAQSRIGISQAGTWKGISVKNIQENVIDFDTSSSDTGCFITEDVDILLPNKMYCWGIFIHAPIGSTSTGNAINLGNQFHVNTIDSERLPQEIIMPQGKNPIQIKVSANWACALMDDGTVWCWGEEMIIPDLDQSQEGRENCAYHSLNDGHVFSTVSSSSNSGNLYYCEGQFRSGDGSTGDLHQIPISGVTSLNLGLGMGCASTIYQEVKCWGLEWGFGTKQASHVSQSWDGGFPSTAPSSGLNGNSNFATQTWVLLDGQTPDTMTDMQSMATASVFSSNRGGGHFDIFGINMCIKVISGKAVCYGSQVGVLNTPFDENKVNTWLDTDDPAYIDGVALFGSEITSVARNVWSICVTLVSSEIYCAGENKYGQLGSGTIVHDSLGHDWTLVDTQGLNFDRVVMSDTRSMCAWNTQNPTSENVLCWGSAFAELPIGQSCGSDAPSWVPCFASSRDIIATPTEAYLLKGMNSISEIQLNAFGGCVIADGNLGCWGHYDGGQGCHSDEQAAVEFIIPGCTTELRVELPGTQNSAPSISSVVITPGSGVSNTDVLVCSITGPIDPDADPLLPYVYEWVLTTPQGDVYTYSATSYSTSNPLDLPATVYSSVFGHLASPGDVIECFVTISDIYGASSTIQSNAVIVMGAKYYDMDSDGYGDMNAPPIYVDYCNSDIDCPAGGTLASASSSSPAYYTGVCINSVCDLGPNYSDNNLDCDDQNPAVNPSQVEDPFNGIDDNCDGQQAQLFLDWDNDGYGDANYPLVSDCVTDSDCSVNDLCVTTFGHSTCTNPSHPVFGTACTSSFDCDIKFTKVASASSFSCALTTEGDAICWGIDGTEYWPLPGYTFSDIEAGHAAVCGLETTSSNIICWSIHGSPIGSNFIQIQASNFQFTSLTLDKNNVCAISTNGELYCKNMISPAAPILQPQTNVLQVDIGISMYNDGHKCILYDTGNIDCLIGGNSFAYDATIPPAGIQFSSIATGHLFTCGIETTTLLVQCWGDNNFNVQSTPTDQFQSIIAGRNTICGISLSNEVICWGKSSEIGHSMYPPQGTVAKSVSVGRLNVCSVNFQDEIYCWGVPDWNNVNGINYPTGFAGLLDGPDESLVTCINGICSLPNYVPILTPDDVDCNDWDPTVNPSMSEVQGNNVDDDCDGIIDQSPTIQSNSNFLTTINSYFAIGSLLILFCLLWFKKK